MKVLFFSFCAVVIGSAAYGQQYRDDCLETLTIPEEVNLHDENSNAGLSLNFDCPPEVFKFSIYDRWGNEVFTTDDYKFFWQGVDKDKHEVPAGAYVYIMQYTFNGGKSEYQGKISLLR